MLVFVAPTDPPLSKLTLLAAIHFMMSIGWLLVLAWLAGIVRDAVERPTFRRWMERISGAVLIALGARLALSER